MRTFLIATTLMWSLVSFAQNPSTDSSAKEAAEVTMEMCGW